MWVQIPQGKGSVLGVCHYPSGRRDDFTILLLKTKENIAEIKRYNESVRYNVSSESEIPVDNTSGGPI